MNIIMVEVLKILVLASVLFVWAVRYSNIVEEFKSFGYPNWLRDIVGIFKISFAIMLINENVYIVKIGALGISALMICALFTHLKVKNPIAKMLPSASLLFINLSIYLKS
jgi:hypothetical protein